MGQKQREKNQGKNKHANVFPSHNYVNLESILKILSVGSRYTSKLYMYIIIMNTVTVKGLKNNNGFLSIVCTVAYQYITQKKL